MDRLDLRRLLDDEGKTAKDPDGRVRNATDKLRGLGLTVETHDGRVRLPRQPALDVDLWEFIDHVTHRRTDHARALLDYGESLQLPRGKAGRALWQETVDAFRNAKAKLEHTELSASTRIARMIDVRETLLKRPLLPGFPPSTPLGDVRADPHILPLPYRLLEETGPPERREHLAKFLARTLSECGGAPSQIVVIGSPGSGKALTARETYLRLTDELVGEGASSESRIVIWADARGEGPHPGFAGDEWLAHQLAEFGADADERPIVIMPHADSFLSANVGRLDEVLSEGAFRKADLLLCCNEQFHAKILHVKGHATHEIKLAHWSPAEQTMFVKALHGDQAREKFKAWRDQFPSRKELCAVPLQLYHAANLIATSDPELEQIDRRWQLFEHMARLRLKASGLADPENEVLADLAAVAHRFYSPAPPAERAVTFTEAALHGFLRERDPERVRERADRLIRRTLIHPVGSTGGQQRFEDLLWSWFFVAYHLYLVLNTSESDPVAVLWAFQDPLSAAVMDRCEEILRDWQRNEKGNIQTLRIALDHPRAQGGIQPHRRVAREHVAYLLGALAPARERERLRLRLDPDRDDYEKDDLVRRGLAIGLANAGESGVADAYVDSLRAEGETAAALRETNIAFALSFHGDQAFDAETPTAVNSAVDPVRTVADLVRGLGRTRHSGTWRIKLFTLLDLARTQATAGAREALASHREELARALEELEADENKGHWPEIREMRELLADVGAGQASSGEGRRLAP